MRHTESFRLEGTTTARADILNGARGTMTNPFRRGSIIGPPALMA